MPYVIPMLQNAGAIVFTPRERDWQRNEIVIDNDDAVKSVYYFEKEDVYKRQAEGRNAHHYQ